MGRVAVALARAAALLGVADQPGRDGLLDGRPAVRVGVEGRPLSVVVGVRRVDGRRPLQRVVSRRGAVDGVGGVGSGVDVHGVGVSLAAGGMGARRPGGMAGVCAGGGLVGLVHQSVDGVEVLVAAAALRRPPLTAGGAACL